jgi:hypothetical protein
MTLRNNDTQSLDLSLKTVQRFGFNLNLVGAGTPANVVLELIDVKCMLKRSGEDHVLFHENLQLLAQESMFMKGFKHALQKTVIVLNATVGSRLDLLPLIVDLGAPLNLKGDDKLRLEVTTKAGWMGDYDSSQSSIEIEDREAIGVETFIPFIKSRALQATISRDQFSLGHNVTSIAFINTEASRDNTDAQRVWDSVIINTDKVNWDDNRARILGRRASMFEDVAVAGDRKENFKYVPNVELDNVQITIQLNGANVAATKNYIVYRTFKITSEGLNRAQATQAKHDKKNTQKVVDQISKV